MELGFTDQLQVPITHDDLQIHQDLQHAHIPTKLDLHLNCDNQGAIKLAKNPVFHAKTKHIEGKHHFVRERVLEGEIQLRYINTNENPADMFTKAMLKAKFQQHRQSIGIRSLSELQQHGCSA